MPDPTRPVAGAPIDTDWGQQIHDRVFQPKGVRVAGGASSSISSGFSQLQLNTAVDDPGGWLASDTLTVPTGAGGLYSYSLNVSSVNGNDNDRTKIELRVNGTQYVGWWMEQDGANSEFDGKSGIMELSAGDQIQVWSKKSGGANPNVLVRSLDLVLQGTSIGA